MLTLTEQADPLNGKVSTVSPIGLALAGRHPGETIHIRTLDGDTEYQIVKIV
jgi:transcription elongation GreA/GreB family factor